MIRFLKVVDQAQLDEETKTVKGQIIKTVEQPRQFDSKINEARSWLRSRGIHDMKGLYGAAAANN
jgi:hypothetical protein